MKTFFRQHPAILLLIFLVFFVICINIFVLLVEVADQQRVKNTEMEQWVFNRHTELIGPILPEQSKLIDSNFENSITVHLWEITQENKQVYYDIIILKRGLFGESRILETFWILPEDIESFMSFGCKSGLYIYKYSVSANWEKIYGPDQQLRLFA